MTTNQELQVILWNAINGLKMPMNVIKNYRVSKEAEQMFFKIQSDQKLNILLVLPFKTQAEYYEFWNETLTARELDNEIVQFLLSEEYIQMMDIWQNWMLENVIRTSSCEELKALCRALWRGYDDGQIRMYIGCLLTYLEGNVPSDEILQSLHVLAMFADKIAIMDVPNVAALLGKYVSMLNLNIKSL